MKKILTILVLIVAMVGISGCTDQSDNNTTTQSANTQTSVNSYTVGTSTFQITDGWRKVDKYTGNIAGFATGQSESDGALLRVKEYQNANEQNSEYNEFLDSGSGFTVTTTTKTVSGIKTKVVKTVYSNPYEAITDYYFQKNGKYYRVTTDVLSKSVDSSVTNEALEKVISTLNNN